MSALTWNVHGLFDVDGEEGVAEQRSPLAAIGLQKLDSDEAHTWHPASARGQYKLLVTARARSSATPCCLPPSFPPSSLLAIPPLTAGKWVGGSRAPSLRSVSPVSLSDRLGPCVLFASVERVLYSESRRCTPNPVDVTSVARSGDLVRCCSVIPSEPGLYFPTDLPSLW